MLVPVGGRTPSVSWLATAGMTGDTNHLKWCVYTNVMQRILEFQTSSEAALDSTDSVDPSFLCDEVYTEVRRGLRMVSPSVTFGPAATLHSPAEVLAGLVPRLLLSLLAQQGIALPEEQQEWVAFTEVVLSIVQRVLDNLASALDTLDLKVHYSPATGIRMVVSIQKLMGKLQLYRSKPL